jgi:DNA-binding transcriptional LysR family regulator
MQLAQLRAFVSVVDAGGFSTAADGIGRTQSAISHAVASLERELGSRLFHRGREGIALTELGHRVLPYARAALRQVELLRDEATSARGLQHGRLRIGGFPTACQLLPPLIAQLRRDHPGVVATLWEGTDQEVADWLEQNLIDLGVRASLAPPKSSETLLATDSIVAVLEPGHPLAGQPSVTLGELQDDPFLLSDGGCEKMLRDLHHAAGLSLRPAQRVREMRTLLAMVREGLGVTVVPELALSDRTGLVALPLLPAAHRRLLLVTPQSAPSQTAVRAFQSLASARNAASAEMADRKFEFAASGSAEPAPVRLPAR